MAAYLRDLVNIVNEDREAGLDLELHSDGLVVMAWQDHDVYVPLTDEQAYQLERALYLHRIAKPFDERQKEDNA